MKIKRRQVIIIGIGLIFALCIAVLFFHRSADRSQTPPSSAPEIGTKEQGVVQTSIAERLYKVLEMTDAPIRFYGAVVDENGDPVAGADVHYRTVRAGFQAPSTGLSTGSQGTVATGGDGGFSIQERGTSLGITGITKTGYRELRRSIATFSFGSNAQPHQADPAKPILFIVMKGESKVKSKKKTLIVNFDWDGTMIDIPFPLPGRSEVLQITPRRARIDPQSREYQWDLVFRISGGQLAFGSVDEVKLAPNTGYTESLHLQNHDPTAPGYAVRPEAVLYLKFDAGGHGMVKIEAYPDRGKADPTAAAHFWINPNGGRSFE